MIDGVTNGKYLDEYLILFSKLRDVFGFLQRVFLTRSMQEEDILLRALESQELIVVMPVDTIHAIGTIDSIGRLGQYVRKSIELRLLIPIDTIEPRTETAEALATRRRLLHFRPTAVVVRPQAQERRVPNDRRHLTQQQNDEYRNDEVEKQCRGRGIKE